MKLLSAVLCLTIVACVVADYGYYVPKAFYRIDENGQKSQTYFIEVPEGGVHPRFRRSPQVQPGFGFGFQPFPQFGFPPLTPGQGVQIAGVSSSVNSGGPNLNSRFGEDDGPQTQGQTTTFHSNNGQTVETTHRFGPDGKVQTNTNKYNTGGPNLNSRFGENDGPQSQGHSQGQTTTFHSNNGAYVETTHRFGPDGKVETTVNKGKA